METDTQLDSQELQAWRSLLKANSALVNVLDRELEQSHNLGLPDYEVLTNLSQKSDGSLRMTELAREVLLSPSGLTRRLDGLVKAGFVERQPCPSDGRGLLAVITTNGTSKLDQMQPTYVSSVRKYFLSCLSQQQVSGLINALEPVIAQNCDTSENEATTDLTRAERSTDVVAAAY